MEKTLINKIDNLVKCGYYSSRSEFVRKAIILLIRRIVIRHKDLLGVELCKEILATIENED